MTRELDNIDNGIGLPDWRLTMCLAVVWLLIFLTVCKGMKSTGKASYFLALFPYIVLLIFLVRGVTLPGSWEGIRFFIEPQWEKVLEPTVRLSNEAETVNLYFYDPGLVRSDKPVLLLFVNGFWSNNHERLVQQFFP